MALWSAIETMIAVKKAYRLELTKRRELHNAKVRGVLAAREGIAA
jgi:hypothetical protein